MIQKKDKVSTKLEREVLSTSHKSINMLSRTLGIKESVIKEWMNKHRPNYYQEFKNYKHSDSRVTNAIEKKQEKKPTIEEEVKTKLEEKEKAELQKAIEIEQKNQNNSAMEDLMAHKETDSKGNRRFVTIMTEPASMRGDEYRKFIKKNDIDQPHIHRPKRK